VTVLALEPLASMRDQIRAMFELARFAFAKPQCGEQSVGQIH